MHIWLIEVLRAHMVLHRCCLYLFCSYVLFLVIKLYLCPILPNPIYHHKTFSLYSNSYNIISTQHASVVKWSVHCSHIVSCYVLVACVYQSSYKRLGLFLLQKRNLVVLPYRFIRMSLVFREYLRSWSNSSRGFKLIWKISWWCFDNQGIDYWSQDVHMHITQASFTIIGMYIDYAYICMCNYVGKFGMHKCINDWEQWHNCCCIVNMLHMVVFEGNIWIHHDELYT